MKFTKHNLKKVQALLEESGYEVRYEKGNFQSGYCLVENRRIAVINRFFDTEGRMATLLDIISRIGIKKEDLSDEGLKTFKALKLEKEEPKEEEKEAGPEPEAETKEDEPEA